MHHVVSFKRVVDPWKLVHACVCVYFKGFPLRWRARLGNPWRVLFPCLALLLHMFNFVTSNLICYSDGPRFAFPPREQLTNIYHFYTCLVAVSKATVLDKTAKTANGSTFNFEAVWRSSRLTQRSPKASISRYGFLTGCAFSTKKHFVLALKMPYCILK